MKLKKILGLSAVTGAAVFGLASCGGTEEPTTTTATSTATATTTATASWWRMGTI